jgi:acyl-ACP thioesterase
VIVRGDGRVVSESRRVRLGDVTPGGRLRLDALARYLQDVAGDDTADAALPSTGGWILRRLALDVGRLPRLGDRVESATRCTGVGRGWAERTTTVSEGGTVAVTARAVWVYIDLATGAPQALPRDFFVVYGDAVRDHRVSARLTLPRPPAAAVRSDWAWRATDVDVYEHVNNASYWVPVEQWLAESGRGRRVVDAVVEFGAGMDPAEDCRLMTAADADTLTIWCCVGDTVRAAAHVAMAPIT